MFLHNVPCKFSHLPPFSSSFSSRPLFGYAVISSRWQVTGEVSSITRLRLCRMSDTFVCGSRGFKSVGMFSSIAVPNMFFLTVEAEEVVAVASTSLETTVAEIVDDWNLYFFVSLCFNMHLSFSFARVSLSESKVIKYLHQWEYINCIFHLLVIFV